MHRHRHAVQHDIIHLKNLQFYGRHGVAPEEKALGQCFEIDVDLFVDIRPAAQSDDLTRTINYVEVYHEVKRIVEDECFNLIETLAQTIALHVGNQFGPEAIRVCVRKPHAPIPGVFDYVAVEIERTRETWQSPM